MSTEDGGRPKELTPVREIFIAILAGPCRCKRLGYTVPHIEFLVKSDSETVTGLRLLRNLRLYFPHPHKGDRAHPSSVNSNKIGLPGGIPPNIRKSTANASPSSSI
ncbi:hypothetical protein NPIL_620761 [Nephila pilipes]|uniref:Uncharacterized protein n=1 Tax=Nephila pilipes TaxID=299642 RepID=A0A8X6NTX8_NEPPI|nr:hypothetical protein NPIL_620761 [Nephila pilipes]